MKKTAVIAKPHQNVGVEHLNKFPRVLLADEMGLGKTLMLLMWYVQSKCRTLVVVCPASTLGVVWRQECRKLGLEPIMVSSTNRPPPRLARDDKKQRVLLVSYSMLVGREQRDINGKKFRSQGAISLAMYLRQWVPDALFVDECQAIKDPTSKQTKAVHKLARGIKHIVALSGTPFTTCPAFLFSALNLLWPAEFPSFRPFGVMYCEPVLNRFGGWDYKGASRLKHLRKRLLRCGMLRRRLSEEMPDIRPPRWHMVPIDFQRMPEYQYAQAEFLEWLGGRAPEKAERAKKALAVVRSGYLQRLAVRLSFPAKIRWLRQWLLDHPDKKIAVYAVQTPAIKALMRAFTTYDADGHVVKCIATCVDGSTKDREASVMAFQTNPKVRVFVGQAKAAGAGIPLTACHHVALVEYPWEPATLGQIAARPRRIGQTEDVHVHCLVARHTIEVDQCRVLQSRQASLSSVLDGTASEMSIYDELLRRMAEKVR